jgi:hypothetical protein
MSPTAANPGNTQSLRRIAVDHRRSGTDQYQSNLVNSTALVSGLDVQPIN